MLRLGGLGVRLGMAALIAVIPTHVWAHGVTINEFDSADAHSAWFVLQSESPKRFLHVTTGLTLEHITDPVVVYDANGVEQQVFVSRQTQARPALSLRFAKDYVVTASIPVMLAAGGHVLNIDGQSHVPPSGMGVGDLRLGVNASLLTIDSVGMELMVGARVWIPTGKEEQLTSDGGARVAPHVAIAGLSGVFKYAARVGLDGHFEEVEYGGQRWGTRIQGAAAVGLEVFDHRLIAGPELFASTAASDDFLASPVTRAEALFGVHYRAFEQWLFGAGCGFGLTTAIGVPDLRLLAMASWNYASEPNPPPRALPPPAKAAEPPPAIPSPAPRVAEPVAVPADNDADGIIDADDACPNVPGRAADDKRFHGCPPAADTDGDGIFDLDDACVTVAGVASKTPERNGCPALPADSDGDGIEDANDACPKVPGVTSPEPAANGCPRASLTGKRIEVMGRIEFETSRSRLLPESEPVLTAVLQILQHNSNILRLSIEGHTDDRGRANDNLQLSLSRAEAVASWLTKQGIEPNRLVARGLGAREPIDTNETEAGRRNNRRVEFHVIKFKEEEGAQ